MAIDQPQRGVVPGRTPSLQRQINSSGARGGQPAWTTLSGGAPNVTSPTGATGGMLPTGNMNAPTSVTGS